ncbi:MAG TPA: lyase family protein [Candidatus Binataceae bacterium]|nr:lyase family protein [Candidatus Binataceae bacterium]
MAARRKRRIVSASSRIERDSLGELAVPSSALYGIQTLRSLANLSFSRRTLGAVPEYVRALAQVKKAAALANRDAGVVGTSIAAAIARACDSLIGGDHLDQFPVDPLSGGGSIAINMNINEVIANLANETLGGQRGAYDRVNPKTHVNASQSTADACQTAARIAIVSQWPRLRAALDACIAAMRAKEREFRRVITVARTCLQDASPVALGTLFGGYAAAIARRASEIDRAVDALHRINLGGTAIGSGESAPLGYRRVIVKRLCEVTGLRLARKANLFDAAQNIDELGALAAALGLLAEVLLKVAQDLRLLSSGPEGGFGEIRLPAVQEGSSFFAGKINPVIPETLMQCCFQVLACERAARLALQHGELNLNVFEGVAAANILDAIAMLERSLATFTEKCVRGIEANEARCRDLAKRSRFRSSYST